MRRREFTSLLGGAVATWPIFASAQGVTSPGLQAAPARLWEALLQTISGNIQTRTSVDRRCRSPLMVFADCELLERLT
jgi:hypothetical protein